MNYPLNKTYEERLQRLNLLPLWFYFELHDLLFLLDIFVNKYDYDFSEQIRGVVTMTRQGKKKRVRCEKKKTKESRFQLL